MSSWHFLDTPLAVGLRFLGDLLVLNLLFLIGSIPLVTAGASFSALYSILLQRVREGNGCPLIRPFLQNYLRNFWKASCIFGITVLLLLLAWGDFMYCQNLTGLFQGLYGILAAVFLLAALTVFVLGFPLQSAYENSLKNYLKNCFLLLLASPLQVLGSMLAWIAPWALLLAMPSAFLVKFGAAYLMWGFAFPAWCTAKLLQPVFQKLTK